MKIFFSPTYTSRVYTETLPLGSEVCNLQQLVNLIELHSGIYNHEYSQLEMQVIYMQALIKMNSENPHNVIYQSLKMDPISTARTCLEWRNLLVLAGWNKEMMMSKRIEALAIAEPFFNVKTLADRVMALPGVIKDSSWMKGIEMEVQFDEKLMHPAVHAIVDAMRKAGVSVSYPADETLSEDCNLSRFRCWMQGRSNESPSFTEDDGTLYVYRFANRQHVLQHISRMDSEKVKNNHWISERRGDIDMALRAGGKATGGSMMENTTPSIVQLLPLAISLFLRPLDINKLLAWLQSPRSPLEWEVRYAIAGKIMEKGGWNEEDITEVIQNCLKRNPKLDENTVKDNVTKFVFINSEDIKRKDVFLTFMKQFQTWAREQQREEFQHEYNSQYEMLLSRISALMLLAEYHTSDIIDNEILRQWEILVNEEGNYEMYSASCNGPIVCSSPGDMIGNTEKTYWVGFSNHSSFKALYSFLTSNEKEELRKRGCNLYTEDNEMKAHKIINLWPLSHTRHLVIIEMEEKEPDEIRSTCSQQWRSLEKENRSIITKEVDSLVSNEITTINHFNHEDYINIKNADKLKWRETESFSSFDLLIQYPLEYVLKYCLGLNPDDTVNIHNSTGNVAHKVIETIFQPGLKAQKIRTRLENNYDRVFEESLQSRGMILLLSENYLALKNLRNNLRTSMESLIDIFEANDMETVKCEEHHVHPDFFDKEVKVEGYLDMHVKDGNGNHAIIDLKWSNWPQEYENQISQERALQLDFYQWLLSKSCDNPQNIRSAYFVMPINRLFTHCDFLVNNAYRKEATVAWEERIQRIKNSFSYRKNEILNGSIEMALECDLGDIQYHQDMNDHNLVPLKQDNKKKQKNPFSGYTIFYL